MCLSTRTYHWDRMFACPFDIFPIFVETENMYVLYTSAVQKRMINNVSITILQIMTEKNTEMVFHLFLHFKLLCLLFYLLAVTR